VPTIYPFACFLDCTDSHFVLLRVSLVNQQSLNAMKKVILVSLVVFGLATLGAQAQTNTTTGNRTQVPEPAMAQPTTLVATAGPV
jgi:hypothetical protein